MAPREWKKTKKPRRLTTDEIDSLSIVDIDRIIGARISERERLEPGRREAPHWTYDELSRLDDIREEMDLLYARRKILA